MAICLLVTLGAAAPSGAPAPLSAPAQPATVAANLTATAVFAGWNQTGTPCGGGEFSIWGVFDGNASGGTPPYSYAWVFGDGTPVSMTQNPTHVFVTDGPWNVTLTVTDAAGTHATRTVTVSPAIFSCPAEGVQFPTPLAPWEPDALLVGAAIVATVGVAVLLATVRHRPPP